MTAAMATSPTHLPPSMLRLSDYVEWYAEKTPDGVAMVHEGDRISYQEFRDRIDALARAFLAMGVGKGDRVATLAPPSHDYFIAFLAASSIGAIWVGMNPRYQREELSYVVADSEPKVILARSAIGNRDYLGELDHLAAQSAAVERVVLLDGGNPWACRNGVSMDDFLSAGDELSVAGLNAARKESGGREPCMIVYTSGSTGKPKGALLHHEGIIEFSLAQNRLWPISPLRMLNYFPINHVGCVVDVSVPCLVAGGTIVFLEQFTPAGSLELIAGEKVTLWGSVPSVFQMQLDDENFADYDLSSVQMIAWGGAKMPEETLTRLMAFGLPMATNYGMTESSSAITATPATRDRALLEETVGWPFEGTEIRLLGVDGKDAGPGEAGEVLARSRYNMLGYWRRPEATAETLSKDGWLHTGDIARANEDGSYSIVGRAKEMYKSGGYNVYPREVEEVLESHPAIAVAAVVAAEDPVWQEVGVAYLEATESVTAEEMASFCRSRLANYKIPKLFVPVPSLPLLPIGKVDKVELKRRAQSDYGDKGNVS